MLARIQRTAVAAFAHQDFPFPLLAERLQPRRDPSRSPLFQVFCVLEQTGLPGTPDPGAFALGQAGHRLRWAGLELTSLPLAQDSAQFDLMLLAAPLSETGAEGGLALALEYNPDLFDAATAERLLGHLEQLLAGAAAESGRRVAELPLLTAAERAELAAWGRPRGIFADGPPLHRLFEAHAAADPRAVAAVCDLDQITYGRLDERANRLAHRLRELGVGPEVPVGLCLAPSIDLLVGILGILKAGGGYVPLDPAAPAERLRGVLADAVASAPGAGAPVLVTNRKCAGLLAAGQEGGLPGEWRTVLLDAEAAALAALPGTALPASDVEVAPANLAYVIYTSGSTGTPKGVPVPHGNVVRLLRSAQGWGSFDPDDVWTLFHSFSFDFSVWEIWGALAFGGRLVIVPEEVRRAPGAFYELLATEGVTVLSQTPAAFRQLIQAEEEDGGRELELRLVVFGGEALEVSALAPWWARHGDARPRLVNMYGITETTVHVTWRPLTEADLSGAGRAASPLGPPLDDLALHLLDARGEPVPDGVPGEIWVGGPGLARGYLGRGDLTADRFRPDPDPGAPGGRLYKSGDLARRRNGELEYLGRADHQVKVRGIRIELGEIEAALAAHPAVREAVVLARRDDGETRLVGYVVARGAEVPAAELRRHLAARLPEAMIPAAWVALPGLPLTPTGKVDRRALPAPGAERPDLEAAFVAPRTPVEERLAALWCELLRVERVGVHDSFFELGGHSLLATRLLARLRTAFGVEVPLRRILEEPTLGAVAAAVEAAGEPSPPGPLSHPHSHPPGRGGNAAPTSDVSSGGGAPSPGGRECGWERGSGGEGPAATSPTAPRLPATPRPDPLPLTFGQERLWVLDRLEPESPWYNVPAALELTGPLDRAALAAALGGIVRRHEVLRTTFPTVAGRPVQRIAPPPPPTLPLIDLADLPAARATVEAARVAAAEAIRPFDLAIGPLFRPLLLARATHDHLLLATLHHIVSDGWSIGVLARELGALYTAAAADATEIVAGAAGRGRPLPLVGEGRGEGPTGHDLPIPPPLPNLPTQVADFAVWQRGPAQTKALSADLVWWREQLAGLPPALELPADRPRGLAAAPDGGSFLRPLPPALSGGIARTARAAGTTPFAVLFAGLSALLGRRAGVTDLALGAPVAGRTLPEVQDLIGFFVNTLVLRADLAGDPTWRELLHRSRETVTAAQAHQDLPFERLVEELAPVRDPARPPLVQVVLGFQDDPTGDLALPGLRVRPLEIDSGTVKFDLILNAARTGHSDQQPQATLAATWRYRASLFDAATVQRLAGHLETLLAAAVADPDRRLADLPLLGPAERHQLLVEWAGTPAALPAAGSLHELFLARAAERPAAPAVTGVASGSATFIDVGVELASTRAEASSTPTQTEGGNLTYGLTYGDLEWRSAVLAAALRARGVGRGARVGVHLERSPELIVALLAVLRTGAAYVPLDPSYPAARIAHALADSGVRLLLSEAGAELAVPAGVTVLSPSALTAAQSPGDASASAAARFDRLPADPPCHPTDPAYVIYTSGSTGRPKGVVVSHGSVLALLAATAPRFGFGPADVWTLAHSYAFDFSVWEIWGALAFGGRLVVVPPAVTRAPERLLDLVARERVTVLNQTPSAFYALARADEAAPRDLADLRLVIFGGEALEVAALAPWLARRRPHVDRTGAPAASGSPSPHDRRGPELVNMYGITETTVHVTWRWLEPADLRRPGSPVGRPLPHLALHLLDRAGQPVPAGVPGEIAVGGAGLAQGYLGRGDLTADRFRPDPFAAAAGHTGARLYHSGDLGRFRPDGDLEVLGRIDRQVKLRGFRIELGEIEAALVRQAAVREAVVLLREDRPGDPRLVAYVVAAPAAVFEAAAVFELAAALEPTALRAALAAELPEHMVPAAVVVLDRLPLTANGKVDRAVLPAPGDERPEPESTYLAPRNPLEVHLAALFQEVLGLARVGIRDDFFALGGNSLTGAVLINRLQEEAGEILHVVTIFDAPTVADLAAHLLAEHPLAAARILGARAAAVPSALAEEPPAPPAPPAAQAQTAPPSGRQPGDRLSAAELATFRALLGPPRRFARPREQNPPALFVLAPPRSGTTLLRVMLAGHPGLFAPPELELLGFESLAARRAAFSGRGGRDLFWLEGATRAVMEALSCNVEEATGRLAEAEAEGLSVQAFYRRLQGWLAGRLLVDKTPSYALDLGVLARAEELFEEPLYVHLVRHPGGMVASFEEAKLDQIFLRRPHGFARRRLAELIWLASHENLLAFLASVPEHRRVQIAYEDLVSDPHATLERLCDGLGLPFYPQMADPYADLGGRMTDGLHAASRMLGDVKLREHHAVDPAAAERWRDRLREDDLGDLTLALAARLGCRLENPPPEPSPTRTHARPGEGERRPGPANGADSAATGPGGGALSPLWERDGERGRATPTLPQGALPSATAGAIAPAASAEGPGGGNVGAELASAREGERVFREYPLSFAQLREWVLDQLDPGSPAYNVLPTVRLEGPLDVPALAAAFRAIVRRHEILRTTFPAVDGEPVQRVAPDLDLALPVVDLAALPAARIEPEARRLAEAEARFSFRLDRGPLLRTVLLRLAPTDHALCLTLHHIAADGWSMGVLVREVNALYRAAAAGLASSRPALPPLPIQYGDFAVAQRRRLQGDVLTRLAAYWQGRFAVPPPVLELGDRPRPPVRSLAGGQAPVTLPRPLAAALGRLAARQGASLYMALLAGFAALLARWSGQRDLAVGTYSANRTRADLEPLLGFFVNTLPLRLDLAGDPDFTTLLARTRESALGAFAHQELPFEKILEAIGFERGFERSLAHTPLFQAMLVLQNARRPELDLPGVRCSRLEVGTPKAHFDLTVWLTEERGEVGGSVEYAAALFEPATVRRLIDGWLRLLTGAAAEPGRRLSALPLLSEAERHQVEREWGSGPAAPALAPTMTFPALLAARAAERPAAPALADPAAGQELSYSELLDRVERLASALRARGVGPEVRVGLAMGRSADLVTAMLGVLQAGGAYVPLDPAYPAERRRQMAEDGGLAFVLTGLAELEGAATGTTAPAVLPEAAAYVIFTSGSSGRPKPVAVPHRALAWYAVAAVEHYGLRPDDRVLQLSSPSFDNSVEEIFPALAGGAAVVLRDDAATRSIADLYAFCGRHGVTRLHPPTAFWHEMAASGEIPPAGLRSVVIGGERPLPERVAAWRQVAGKAALINSYGPTEATVVATVCRVNGEGGELSIGRPVPGAVVRVLDSDLQVVPGGAAGELCLGGEGLSRGYLGRPRETAVAFVPDPVASPADGSGRAGTRLYRTGDRARFLPDGRLAFLGRVDQQVKIRGFRVEPGEIESELARHPGVLEAAVVARTLRDAHHSGGGPRLVAYVVARPAVTEPELRAALAGRLPAHMVPAAFVLVPELPRTPAGKIDRRALPDPTEPGGAAAPAAGPLTGAEAALARVWAEVLGRPAGSIGAHDDFFGLGGDSILAIQVIARAARAGLRLTPRQLFENPTISGLGALARLAEGVTGSAVEAEQGLVAGEAPLTPYQRWFFDLGSPEPWHWNMAVLLRVEPRVTPAALDAALARLLEHHDALRLRFQETAAGWRQSFSSPGHETPFGVLDLANLPTERREAAFSAAANAVQASFDLARGPVLRAALIDLGTQSGQRERRLLLAVHHLVIDGVSWRLLLEDLGRCLAVEVEPAPTRAETSSAPTLTANGQRGEPLPPKTTSYRRWAERLAAYAGTPEANAELATWADLAGRPVRSLPLDHPDQPDAPAAGDVEGGAASLLVQLDEDETRALLQEVPRPYRTRIDDALLAALARAFTRWTGGSALRIDLEAHGREELFADVDLSRTVGCFTSLYPAVLDLAGATTPAEALKAVKEQLRAVPRHGVGFGVLRYLAADPEVARALDAIPPAEVSFNYLGQLDGTLPAGSPFASAAEPAGAIRSPRSPRPCRLELLGSVAGGRLRLVWRYDARALRGATVERLAAGFLAELRELIAHCLTPEAGGLTPSDVPLARLGQPDLDRLLHDGPAGDLADLYPLSPLQEGMLFHSLLAPSSGVYVVQGVSTLAGDMEPDLLCRAWQGAVDRHPILRTAFLWQGLGQSMAAPNAASTLQAVHRRAALPFTSEDWRDLPADEKERRFAGLLAADRRRGFDLDRPPLLRILLVRWAEREWRQVWSHHHLLLDAWSGPLVTADVATLYRALARNEEARLPERRPFRDFIAWLQARDAARSEAYWRHQLRGLRAPTPLGFALPAPAERTNGHAEIAADLPAAASAALAGGARRHRLTQSTLLQAAWALLLARCAAGDLVVFGVTVAGRPPELPGAESIVGPFINTLPVRVEAPPAEPLLPWLEALQAAQAALSEHEQTPLVRIQGWSEVPRDLPLFESLLLVENLPPAHLPADGATGFAITAGTPLERTNYPVTVIAAPGDRLRLRLAWQIDRLDTPAAHRLLGHLDRLLQALAAALSNDQAATLRLDHLDMLSPAERHQLQVEWGAPAAAFPADPPLHELFEAQVRRQPQAPALTFQGETLTYAQLDTWASHLAHRLRELGVNPEVRVAICTERSPSLIAALLAVLKAGGAYVPLDPAYPAERLAWLLADSGAAVLLAETQPVWADGLHQVPYLDLSPSGAGLTSPPALPGRVNVPDPKTATSENAAYVLYTSGSTGRPKGVVVPHAAVTRLLTATDPWFHFDATDVWTLFHSYAFDFSVWEIWGALAFGGRLVIVPRDTARSPEDFLRLLATEGVTVLNQTPSAFRPLAAAAVTANAPPLALRTVIFGGEALEPATLAPWLARFGAAAPSLVNMYGITETTVHVTYRPLAAADLASSGSPIGWPIPDLALHLADRHLRPVPVGVPGEILVGGPGLARGYHGRPDLTAERFVPDPFGVELGARLYRSGDLARRRPDGGLEYLGRLDHQVKIRGFRIELGEIEAALLAHSAVREAVVLAGDSPAGPRLTAYVVAPPETALAGLHAFLAGRLPEHMVPAAVVRLDLLPLTVNGKVDRQALAQLAPEAGAASEAAALPRTPTEEVLAAAFAEVLGRPAVGIHDSFFELGGHSLVATRLVSRLRDLVRVDLPLAALFEAPTVAGLAPRVEALERGGTAAPPAPILPTPRNAATDLPLSASQLREWFLDQLDPGSPDYNIHFALHFTGPLDAASLAACFREVVRRHEVLRTSFPAAAGRPLQRVAPAFDLPLPTVDLAALGSQTEAAALCLAAAEARTSFPLATGPLLRTTLLRLGPADHVLCFTIHHIAADGWSMGVLVSEVRELYRGFVTGREPALPELPVQYADFALWQREQLQGETLEQLAGYWRARLADLPPPVLELPTDRPRPAVRSERGARRRAAIPTPLAADLRRLALGQGSSLFMVLLAGFEAVLARWSGQPDLCVGTFVAGRTRAEIEPLIGFFVNTLALRTNLADAPSFAALLGRVREATLGAYAHQELPFERLLELLQVERSPAHTPLFQTQLVLQNMPLPDLDLPGLSWRPFGEQGARAHFDLTLWWSEEGGGLAGWLDYAADLFDPATAERLLGQLGRLLAGAAERPELRLADLPLLGAAERHQLLAEWNDTGGTFAATFAELFAAQAARTPQALALLDPTAGVALTYAELDAWSRRLARALRRLGVAPEVRVGLEMRRSAGLLAAILGVLRAGGAYVPLDPDYPAERLAAMAEDAGFTLRIRDLSELGAELEAPSGTGAGGDPTPLPLPAVLPAAAAYVIYTSGSTGRPKGVVVSHRSLAWYADAAIRHYGVVPEDRALQFSSISFDISVEEIFPTLAAGAALVLRSDEMASSAEEFCRRCQEWGVSGLYLATAFWHELAAAVDRDPGLVPERLRLVCMGGEKLRAERVAAWRRAVGAGVRLVNSYGPTETTVVATVLDVAEGAGETEDPPIGRPVPGALVRVLDADLEVVPVGGVGELCLGGEGVGRGYLGRPAETAATFVPDPCADRARGGARLYRTGDRVRFLPDGRLVFLGRVDQQVKIRGFRVEPGEVEAALALHPAVREAVVVAREDGGGVRRLVAYVVAREGMEWEAGELRGHLSGRLPAYLVPAAFVTLPALPLTPSGKLDRRALPAPEAAAPPPAEEAAPPRTPAEVRLAAIWAELLGVRVGVHDNFFALGGDSILSIQVIARAAEAGLRLTPRQLFEHPTVAGLAALAGAGAAVAAEQEAVRGEAPLTPYQAWFFAQGNPEPWHWNMAVLLALRRPVAPAALAGALARLIDHHDGLRLRFVPGGRTAGARSTPRPAVCRRSAWSTSRPCRKRFVRRRCGRRPGLPRQAST